MIEKDDYVYSMPHTIAVFVVQNPHKMAIKYVQIEKKVKVPLDCLTQSS